MAKPELGLKRQCMSCGAKFYDLGRDPAVCPKCGTAYQATTSRVSAPALSRSAPAPADEEDEAEDKGGPEIVSLDEVEAAEDEAETSTDDEAGDDAESGGEDDTFLEEEDSGNDDVSDLIDGDIENDEES